MALKNDALCWCYNQLTKSENAATRQIRSTLRRSEWIAARVLSKYTYVRGRDERVWNTISLDDVRAMAARFDFHTIEVTKLDGLFGPPFILDKNTDTWHDNISLSHKYPYLASASWDPGAMGGVDIEKVTNFSTDFVRHYFRSEIAQTQTISRRYEIDESWLFTLLWTIKEAYLKATRLASPLQLHEIRVVFLTDLDSLSHLFHIGNRPHMPEIRLTVSLDVPGKTVFGNVWITMAGSHIATCLLVT